MRRLATVTGIVAVSLVATAAPALAGNGWGSMSCDHTGSAACDVGAGTSGDGGKPGGNAGSGNGKPVHPLPGNSSESDVNPGDKPPSGVIPAAFVRPSKRGATVVEPAVFVRSSMGPRVVPVAAPGQSGAWYVWKCSGPGTADAVYRPPVWIPGGQQPGAVGLPSPAELAAVARRQLRLPTPAIAANPVGDQLVNLATWLWLSSGWGPVSATASVPGVSVTAVATPRSVVWSMGDGHTVTCTGAGTPFHPGTDPKAASPDCGHTYRASSASQPREAFRVTATETY